MSADLCPQCGSPRVPGSRFCGTCAYDFWKAAEGQSTSPQPPAQPPTDSAPVTAPASPPQESKPAGTGRNWGRIALAVIGVVIALAVIGTLVGAPGTAGESPEAAASATTEPTPTPTARPTPRPTPTPVARADLILVEQGFTPGSTGSGTDWAQVGLVFENPNPATHVARFVSIQLTFFDANNALAGSSEETIGPILPGQRGAFGGPVFDVQNAVDMEVSFRVDWETTDVAVGHFTFEQVSTQPEQFGGFRTQGFIVSTFEAEQENVQVVAIYKDAAGNVLGGEFTFVDFVPAGGQSPFELSTFSQFNVAVATTDMYAFVGF